MIRELPERLARILEADLEAGGTADSAALTIRLGYLSPEFLCVDRMRGRRIVCERLRVEGRTRSWYELLAMAGLEIDARCLREEEIEAEIEGCAQADLPAREMESLYLRTRVRIEGARRRRRPGWLAIGLVASTAAAAAVVLAVSLARRPRKPMQEVVSYLAVAQTEALARGEVTRAAIPRSRARWIGISVTRPVYALALGIDEGGGAHFLSLGRDGASAVHVDPADEPVTFSLAQTRGEGGRITRVLVIASERPIDGTEVRRVVGEAERRARRRLEARPDSGPPDRILEEEAVARLEHAFRCRVRSTDAPR